MVIREAASLQTVVAEEAAGLLGLANLRLTRPRVVQDSQVLYQVLLKYMLQGEDLRKQRRVLRLLILEKVEALILQVKLVLQASLLSDIHIVNEP
jgi:hypothetical protein